MREPTMAEILGDRIPGNGIVKIPAYTAAQQQTLEEQVREEREQREAPWGATKILKIPPETDTFRKSEPTQPLNQLPYQVGQRVRLRRAGSSSEYVGTIDRIVPAGDGFAISAKWPGGSCFGVYRLDEISPA